MNVASRGQLLQLIEEKGVETLVTKETEDKKTNNTIIHCAEKRKFYRLVWGEVRALSEVYHIWYEERAEEVTLDSLGKLWLTKEEQKIKQEEMLDKMSKFDLEKLQDLEGNLSFLTQKDNDKIKYVGGAVGKGKTTYVLTQVLKKLTKGDSVLLMTDEISTSETFEKAVEILMELYGKNKEEAQTFLENSKLVVYCDMNHNWNKSHILNKIDEEASKGNGIDFVAIDGLKATPSTDETVNEAYQKMKDAVEVKASEYGFKVLFSVQLRMK